MGYRWGREQGLAGTVGDGDKKFPCSSPIWTWREAVRFHGPLRLRLFSLLQSIRQCW